MRKTDNAHLCRRLVMVIAVQDESRRNSHFVLLMLLLLLLLKLWIRNKTNGLGPCGNDLGYSGGPILRTIVYSPHAKKLQHSTI